MKIVTHHDKPPIPIRSMDWSATLDDYEPGDPIGHGETEGEAVADLIMQIEEQTEEQPCPECGGSGAIVDMRPACCGNLTPGGECRSHCCVPEQNFEQCAACGGSGSIQMEARD